MSPLRIRSARTGSSCTLRLRLGRAGLNDLPDRCEWQPWVRPATVKVGNNPVGVVVSRPKSGVVFAYVLDQEVAPKATVLGFLQNQTTGALTPTPGTVITTDTTGKTVATGYGAGTTPSAIAEDPSSRFVYITDEATNQLYGKPCRERWLAGADGQRAICYGKSSRSD